MFKLMGLVQIFKMFKRYLNRKTSIRHIYQLKEAKVKQSCFLKRMAMLQVNQEY